MNYIITEVEKSEQYAALTRLSVIADELRGMSVDTMDISYKLAAEIRSLRRRMGQWFAVNAVIREEPPFGRPRFGERIELVEAAFIGDCPEGHGGWFDPDGKPVKETECPDCIEAQEIAAEIDKGEIDRVVEEVRVDEIIDRRQGE